MPQMGMLYVFLMYFPSNMYMYFTQYKKLEDEYIKEITGKQTSLVIDPNDKKDKDSVIKVAKKKRQLEDIKGMLCLLDSNQLSLYAGMFLGVCTSRNYNTTNNLLGESIAHFIIIKIQKIFVTHIEKSTYGINPEATFNVIDGQQHAGDETTAANHMHTEHGELDAEFVTTTNANADDNNINWDEFWRDVMMKEDPTSLPDTISTNDTILDPSDMLELEGNQF
ncbi:hypothetical protein ACJX0J_039220 [Zea mays]